MDNRQRPRRPHHLGASYPDEAVAARVLAVLETVRDKRATFSKAARQRGISLEALLAAAITQGIRELLEESGGHCVGMIDRVRER